jgi:hypothetical protein
VPLSASGKITQARVLVEVPAAQPDSISAEAAATAAIEINEVFFISFLSIIGSVHKFLEGVPPRRFE